MTRSRLIIFAPNVRSDGGMVLLRELMESCPFTNTCWLLPDADELKDIQIDLEKRHAFKAGLLARLSAEYFLYRICDKDDKVLMFNGSAPLFPIKASVFVYLQNVLLLNDREFDYEISSRVRIFIERFLLRFRATTVSSFFVQTETMGIILKKFLGKQYLQHKPIMILPFIKSCHVELARFKPNLRERSLRFFYPAPLQAYKNHLNLVTAWRDFEKVGVGYQLHLTISRNELEDLCARNPQLRGSPFDSIVCHGHLSHTDSLRHIAESDALIFPSLAESFGIPLLEATALQKPILAGELDYVRDVCDPIETFDPLSARSIYRSLVRFSEDHPPEVKVIYGAERFWRSFPEECS